MLEGLEAVEINLSSCKEIIDFRIDANTFKKDYLRSEKLIAARNPASIKSLSVSVQNFGAYSLCSYINFVEQGFPFLMTQNVRENYIEWNDIRYIDNRSHEMLVKSHCRKGQVLLTMAGEYLGRAAVYDKDFICSSNQAIAKITLGKSVNPYFISTFLNSLHGQNQINRFRTITGQPNINMALIKSLVIPTVSKSFENAIEEVIKQSYNVELSAKQFYTQAEQLLLQAIGLNNFKPTTKNTNPKKLSESFALSGRLDAEYYLPMYEDYQKLVKGNKSGFKHLEQAVTLKDTNFLPLAKATYKYIELADIGSSGEITGCSTGIGSELPSRARRKVQAGDVIVSSIEGSLQSCAIVKNEFNDALCSTGFYVVRSSQINSETLLVLFKSELMQNLFKQACTGTILTAMNKAEFENVLVPLFESKLQQQITLLIQKSFALKKQSKELLQKAKLAVEVAIEQGEEKGLKILKGN